MSFRVMTYNILDDDVGREPLIREVVQAAQPDVVVLQEVGRQLHPAKSGFTMPTPAPNSRLDYNFGTGALKYQLRQCFVLRELPAVERASDHYPVVAEFDL